MKLHKIGITHGDINGISYELLIKVLQDPEILEIFTPVIFGSTAVAQATAVHLGLTPLPFNIIHRADDAIDGRINLVQVCHNADPELQFGQQTEAALQAEAQSLTAAIEAFSHREIDALVALPGHLDNDETSHSLSEFIQKALGGQEEVFDWVLNDSQRILKLHHKEVTTELGEGLASEAFIAQLNAIYQNLRQDFGLIRPRIAVVSQQQKFAPDIQAVQEQGVTVFGPFSPQAFVEGQWQTHYDGCLFLDADDAMHQVLANVEADHSVGYVSGLPVVLAYPLIGISYDQAGKGIASEVPLRQALYTAIDILRDRNHYRHATHHPLEKQWIPRGRDDFKLDLTKED